MRKVTVTERRARLMRRHRLARSAKTDDPVAIANAVVALHGSDPASVHLAALARMRRPDVGAVEKALYDDHSLARILGMRRTMFVMESGLAPIVQSACTNAIAVQQRKLLLRMIAEAGFTDDPQGWLAEAEEAAHRALVAREAASTTEVSEDEPRLRERLVLAPGKKYESRPSVASRVLFLLAAEGRIIRGRPRGSWISSQYAWSPIETWLADWRPDVPKEHAQAELARRWLWAFGPGTADDLKWWTGWTVAEVKRALAEVGPVEVDLDGRTGLVLADDADRVASPKPSAVLLPGLDPTVMGWKQREWFLGEHGPELFDSNGNAGPTVWWDGRIVGGWAQRPDGDIVYRLLEDVGSEAVAAIDNTADRLSGAIGDVRFTARFRTPLERELSG
ncbi:MAG: winged helix DNA-binding domain-containing protein [Propionibacteriales bacterium]|nr:winged helix DNA-binding domain-containing protein [Propionibacteriales bacterium]